MEILVLGDEEKGIAILPRDKQREYIEKLFGALEDCIVADSMAVWGKAIALKLNIPFVSSTTTFAFNEHSHNRIYITGVSALLRNFFRQVCIRRAVNPTY